MTVISLTLILGFAALSIDVGGYAVDRRNLQNAADAAAMAAAIDLPDADRARDSALAWAQANNVPVENVTVTVTPQDLPSIPNPSVRVEVRRSHTFFFARTVGIGAMEARASARAIKTSPGGDNGLMPWTVNEATLDATAPGEQAVLKYDSNGVHNGNFGALAIDGTGADIYQATIVNGSQNTLCVTGQADCSGVTGETEPGNMAGATRNGVESRLSATDAHCDTFGEVFAAAPAGGGRYKLNRSCNPWLSGSYPSRRVVLIPVTSGEYDGRKAVRVTGFALFFLEGFQNNQCAGSDCNVLGRFAKVDVNVRAVEGVFDPAGPIHFARLEE